MRLIYHPEAETELFEAARYYEEEVAGLGARFMTEWDRAIEIILEAPARWPSVEDDLRRYTMSRFPYGIYYRIEGQVVRILVAKHHSRHPEYWRHRM
jgi:plasmid stabilization system protein ParE